MIHGIKPQQRIYQVGFTLIELIMVIVILGILSAFALPKFADFSGQAKQSSAEGARGAVKSSSAIAHAQYLADGSTGSSVTLDGTIIDLAAGYPSGNSASTNGNICTAAGLDPSDYTCVSAGTGVDDDPRVMTITLEDSTCVFTYTEADTDGDPAAPAISTVSCP